MKVILKLCFLLGIVSSCADREIQLAETSLNTTNRVLDVSPAYIFYNENGTAEFNRKNLIGTTNWLVNVDKRLTLNEVMPHVIYLQEKRNKASMHKNENARNYFTCFNLKTKEPSFIDFTETQFKRDTLFKLVTPKLQVGSTGKPQKIERLVRFKNAKEFYFNKTKYPIDSLKYIVNTEVTSDSISTLLEIGFEKDVLFQDYISLKTMLLKLDIASLNISNTEFIYK